MIFESDNINMHIIKKFIMTVIDAYNFTLEKVLELKGNGIDVTLTSTGSLFNKVINETNHSVMIPIEKWVHVTFKIIFKEDALKIRKMADYLGLCGICFDVGGCSGYRDWELDWSFRYNKGDENWEWSKARERVEEIICQ